MSLQHKQSDFSKSLTALVMLVYLFVSSLSSVHAMPPQGHIQSLGDTQTHENEAANGDFDKLNLNVDTLVDSSKTAIAMPKCHESAKPITNQGSEDGNYSATMSESQCKIVCAVLTLACFDYPRNVELSMGIDSFTASDEKSLFARIIPIEPNPPKVL